MFYKYSPSLATPKRIPCVICYTHCLQKGYGNAAFPDGEEEGCNCPQANPEDSCLFKGLSLQFKWSHCSDCIHLIVN